MKRAIEVASLTFADIQGGEGDGDLTAYATGVNVGAAERGLRLAAWRCTSCQRGVADGAIPNTRKGRGRAKMCVRCARRIWLMKHGKRAPPLDMPDAGGKGGTSDLAALRDYWERRIWDAGCAAFEVETDEGSDPVFREARTRFFALVSLSARYLNPSDYLSQASDVPRFLGCGPNGTRER